MSCELCDAPTGTTSSGQHFRRCFACKGIVNWPCSSCGKDIGLVAHTKGFRSCYQCKDKPLKLTCPVCKEQFDGKSWQKTCSPCYQKVALHKTVMEASHRTYDKKPVSKSAVVEDFQDMIDEFFDSI